MTHYTEKDLETFIEEYLLSQHSYIKRQDSNYDKELCLDSELVLEFLHSTQQDKLEALRKRVGEDYRSIFFKRLSSQIREKGILKALQTFVEVQGIKFQLVYPKPATQHNQQSLQNYSQNIFSIVRQLHYSTRNQNSLDMVVFLNGLPLITLELKNRFTGQNVYDAIKQYKQDRDPREPLFARCIVHFALDHDLAYMTTSLAGEKTFFLPFNRGLNNGKGEIGILTGAGNPPSNGLKTAYIWERILSKDTLLTLILDYVQKVDERLIFPRYHQFDVVEKLLEDCKSRGVGGRYLIQHSAGSGKSNSISWLAHQLIGLHRQTPNGEMEPVFDSAIVVTDRKVLDRQIQGNIKNFSRIDGIVEVITEGSKQLKDALESGKKIIVSTIQKFPYVVEGIGEVKGKKFAVIIDEAHSSQSGISAQKLGEAIRNNHTSKELDLEETLYEMIRNKKLQSNASYFAFTATPKPKTLEMFGTPCEVGREKKFIPFHLYSMKQAIEEGFILDVLRGYITYNSYYKIISTLEDEDKQYDSKKAKSKLKRYVEGDVYAIGKKAEIMIEHFCKHIHKKIGGRAKAMIVTSSRENAVKYYFAFRDYLASYYPHYQALVAFSGDVVLDGESYSESGLNNMPETRLKDEFEKDNYRFLIVAEKYQTGFDQPLLHTMYVDKKLSGVSAVQTLSRLNRTCKNKEDTCVIDFANTHTDIAESFSVFYEQTYLGKATDPDKIFDLKSNLAEYRIYSEEEIADFVNAIKNGAKENIIHSLLDKNVERYIQLGKIEGEDSQLDFYHKVKTYLKDYSFLAQIIPYEDIELEKLYIFLKMLVSKITPPKGEDLAKGILDNVDFDSYRLTLNQKSDISLEGRGELLPSQADGTSRTPEADLKELSEIVSEFNERFGNIDWGEDDKVARTLNSIKEDVMADEGLIKTMKNSDKQNMRIDFEKVLEEKFRGLISINLELFKQFSDNKEFKERITQKMFDMVRSELTSV